MNKILTTTLYIMFFTTIIFSYVGSSAQTAWNLNGNTTIETSSIGILNNHALKIITNNTPRIIVGTNDSIQIKGIALFDSIKIPNGFIQADSIRTRVIHIGDSSITIGAGSFFGTTTTNTNSNNITCSNGVLNFGQSSSTNFTKISLNVGTQTTTYKLHLHDGSNSSNAYTPYIHFTNSSTNQTTADGFLVGIASNGSADLIQHETKPIRFWINSAECMHIQGNNTSNSGFVGIGNGFTNPIFRLDVDDDVNINSNTSTSLTSDYLNAGYRIGGHLVLALPNDQLSSSTTSGNGGCNTFVGRAGNINSNCGWDNTFVGYQAGVVNISTSSSNGMRNTFVGSKAGQANTTGFDNTFLGSLAGEKNSTGGDNTFIGHHSGRNNTVGANNCYIGSHSGLGNSNSIGNRNNYLGVNSGSNEISGDDNQQIGFLAGTNNSTGERNVLIGTNSGAALTGNGTVSGGVKVPSNSDNNNVFVGYQSGSTFQNGNFNTLIGSNTTAANSISHSTAIGDGAIVLGSNQLILGNNVNVGIGMSNVAGGPQNLLELNTPNTFSTTNAGMGTGTSGLRFRDLTQASIPQASNGLALSVDGNGDVILVPNQSNAGSTTLGNACNNTPNPLNTDWEIPLVDPNNINIQNSLFMSGQSDMSGNNPADVGIGYNCGTPLQAKLDVYNLTNVNANSSFYTNAAAGRFIHDGTYSAPAGITDMEGILVESNVQNNYTSNTNSRNIGTHSIALGNRIYNIGSLSETKQYQKLPYQYGTGTMGLVTGSDIQGDGVLGLAYGNTMNVGVHGVAAISINGPNSNVSSNTSIGGLFMTYDPQSKVFSEMDNAHLLSSSPSLYGAHIGVYGGIENSSGTINYPSLTGLYAGVYGEASSQKNSWAGYFNGNIGTTAGYFQVSDSIVKINVVNLSSDSSLHILTQLHPKTYTLDSANYPSLSLNKDPQIGLFAQEVERIIPSAVRLIHHPATIDSVGNIITPAYDVKGLNYIELIPVLVSAIKSLDSTNKSLQNQINTITAAQTGARAAESNANAIKGTEVHLSDLEIVLNQNSPNPFAEQTNISYTIPDNIQDANMVFYTVGGTAIKNVRITERGQGQMTVYAENLSAGMYTYSLIADGKVVATKKMICEKK